MRLIDADKIGLTDFEIVMCDGNYKEALKMVLDKIEKAQTVDLTEKIKKVEEKIDFETKWLTNIKMENGFVPLVNIEIAMGAIRSKVSELKENKE